MRNSIEILCHECPAATSSERQRFLNAKGGDLAKAKEQLAAYLDWRREHCLDDPFQDFMPLKTSLKDEDSWHSCVSDEETLDQVDWRYASQAALLYEQRKSNHGSIKNSNHSTILLPQLTRLLPKSFQTPRDQNNHRILHFLPAMMDLSKASEGVFALSIALYLERKLDRNSFEKITVAIDCRGGTGWANPKPQALIPFLQQVASVLEQNFPERLAKALLFPVPMAAFVLYKVVKRFLDPKTVEKVALIQGDSRNCGPIPYEAMQEYIDTTSLQQMEDFRVSKFIGETDIL